MDQKHLLPAIRAFGTYSMYIPYSEAEYKLLPGDGMFWQGWFLYNGSDDPRRVSDKDLVIDLSEMTAIVAAFKTLGLDVQETDRGLYMVDVMREHYSIAFNDNIRDWQAQRQANLGRIY
jgi:hypothetical protein